MAEPGFAKQDWRNAVPRSVLLALKLKAAGADLAIVTAFVEEGGYAVADLDEMISKVENLGYAIAELRMTTEISADARGVTDEEFEKLIDEADE